MTKAELAGEDAGRGAWLPGKTVKLDFGGDEGVILLDGAAMPRSATSDDGAPTPRSRSAGTIGRRWPPGQLDGMTAFMTGKLKVEGDMGNAMQLQGTSPSSGDRLQSW